ncbi:unnamed protein product [Ixodes hexagonus]
MERLKKDPLHGIDSRRSWIVLGSVAWIMLMSTLSIRSAGVIFVGVMEHFRSSREEASWPVSLLNFAISMGALPLGFVCEYWSCQKLLLACTFLVSASSMLCYFAPDLAFISFFFGIVSGTGIAGIYVAVGSLCCQHFSRWTATASSITWASQSLNVFFGPPVANYFQTEYGTPEMFLFLGALTLHGLPAALISKSPPWQTRRSASEATLTKAKLSKQTLDVGTAEAAKKTVVPVEDNHEPPLSLDGVIPEGQMAPPQSHNQQVTAMSCDHQLYCKILMSQDNTPQSSGKQVTPKTSSIQWHESTQPRSMLKAFASPMFYLDSLSLAIQVFTMTTFFQVYVDLAQDRGIEASQAVFLMYVYSVGDFVIRIIGGIVIDRGYITLEVVILFSFLGCVIACEGVAWSVSLVHLLLSSFVYGASSAIMLSLAPSVIIRDFEGQPVPVVLGGMMFVTGFVLLTRPVFVGYFRDNLGKYDGLMHAMAIPSAIFAVVWCWKLISRRRRIAITA